MRLGLSRFSFPYVHYYFLEENRESNALILFNRVKYKTIFPDVR